MSGKMEENKRRASTEKTGKGLGNKRVGLR